VVLALVLLLVFALLLLRLCGPAAAHTDRFEARVLWPDDPWLFLFLAAGCGPKQQEQRHPNYSETALHENPFLPGEPFRASLIKRHDDTVCIPPDRQQSRKGNGRRGL